MATPFDEARDKWPRSVNELTPRVQAVYQAWLCLRVPDLDTARGGSPVAIVPPSGGRYVKPDRARDLTLARAPFPVGTPAPPAVLTEAEVLAIGITDSASGGGSDDEGSSSEITELRDLVQNQQIAINKLLLQQEALADDKDATSTYAICEATLRKVPTSVREVTPMSRVDRRRLRRDHGGSFPKDSLPKELHLPDDVKNEKAVAAAKLTLVSLTKDVITPLMEGNMEVFRMAGTVHSRLAEFTVAMQAAMEDGSDSVVAVQDVLEELELLMGAAGASMELVLDLHARMRTQVTGRVERAMGFHDLHDDPNRRGKETFLSSDFQVKIEEKAKAKAHMAWARSGSGQAPSGSLHGAPPFRKTGGGGGQKKTWQKPKSNGSSTGNKSNGGKGGGGRGTGGDKKGGGRGKGSSGSSSSP